MNNNSVYVSILMAVYNGAAFIGQAIASVLHQSFENFQFLIIDDASTDTTSDIIQRYADQDKRIDLYTNNKNLGLTCSLNYGLKYCRGAYIARIDSDDIWHQDKLLYQMEYLKRHPDCALLGTAYFEIDKKGRFFREATVPLIKSDESIRRNIIKFNPFFHSSVIFRKDICIRLGGYDETYRYAQDYNLWVRIVAHHQVANLPQILSYRRMTSDNISAAKERRQRWYAIRSKLLAHRLLKRPFCEYRYLLNDIGVLVLPCLLVQKIRKYRAILNWR